MQIKSALLDVDLRYSISDALEIDANLTAGVFQQYGELSETVDKLRPVLQTMTLSEVRRDIQLLTDFLTLKSDRSRPLPRSSSSASNHRTTGCLRSYRQVRREPARPRQ